MKIATVEYPGCRHSATVAEFLTGCSRYWTEIDAVTAACPTCGETTDARLEDAMITLGYVYAAGSVHFAGMVKIAVPGLLIVRNGDCLNAEISGRTWTVTEVRKP